MRRASMVVDRKMSFFGDNRRKITLQEIKNSSLPIVLESGVYTFSTKIIPTLASEEMSVFRVNAGAMVTIEITEGGQLGVDIYSPNLHPHLSLIEMDENSSLTIKGGTLGPIPHGSVVSMLGPRISFQAEQTTFLNFGSHALSMPVAYPGCEILIKFCKFISTGAGLIGREAVSIVNELGKLSKLELECSQKKLLDKITETSVEKNDMYDVQAICVVGAQKITIFQCLFDIQVFPSAHFSAPTSAISCKQCPMVDIKGCTVRVVMKYSQEQDNRSAGYDAVAIYAEECSRVSIENIMASEIVSETGHASAVKVWKCSMAKLKTNTVEKIQAGSEHGWIKVPQVIVFYASECMINLEDNSNKVLQMVSVANPLFIGIESFPTSKGTFIVQQPRRNY